MHDVVEAVEALAKGYRVKLGSGRTLHLSKADFSALPLAEGEAVDWETYRHALLLRQYPEALNRAVRLLATRARGTEELSRRLQALHYLPDTVELVLYKLAKEKLLDDEAFARAWAENRAARGIGKARLKMELRQKGVPAAAADEAVAALDEADGEKQALALAEKLLRRHAGDSQAEAYRKALAAMQRRGYGYGEAAKALRAVSAQASDKAPEADDE